MKAHEETWEADVGNFGCGKVVGDSIYAEDGCAADVSYDAARLASAAPEMARLLCEMSWPNNDRCPAPTCHGIAGEHTPDCPLIAVLTKAGLLTSAASVPEPAAEPAPEPRKPDDEQE